MSKKTCLVTGATGQAGKYLIELLLEKEYKIYGMIRRSSTVTTERIAHLLNKIELISGDMTDESSLISVLEKFPSSNKAFNILPCGSINSCSKCSCSV